MGEQLQQQWRCFVGAGITFSFCLAFLLYFVYAAQNRTGTSIGVSTVTTGVQTEAVRVVVLAYYRGGSTLTGQMFNFNPSAFYLFEPLAAVAMGRHAYNYRNGSAKLARSRNDALVVDTLRTILSCNFTHTDIRVFKHTFMQIGWTKKLMLSTEPFRSCMQNERRVIESCIRKLAKKCSRSTIVSTKVIRLTMNHAELLLKADPSIKLVHAVRDPRGMTESRKKLMPFRRTTSAQKERALRLQCDIMLSDCTVRRRLERQFPGRILLMRYEDLVASPERVIRDVYSGLLKLPVPDSVIGAIKSQLHASRYDIAVGTKRTNGSATASNWLRTFDKKRYQNALSHCRLLLSELNYDP